jgi:hypothetical protein
MFGASASAPAPTGGHHWGFVMPSVFDVSASNPRCRNRLHRYRRRSDKLLVGWNDRCWSSDVGRSWHVLGEEIVMNGSFARKDLLDTSERIHAVHRNASAVSDPAFTPFVSASVDEIQYAQRLRDRLRERYPNLPSMPVSFWSIGAD